MFIIVNVELKLASAGVNFAYKSQSYFLAISSDKKYVLYAVKRSNSFQLEY